MVSISGGNGSSLEKAIIISDCDDTDGVNQEYIIAKKMFSNFKFKSQTLIEQNGRYYDKLELEMENKITELYFDITDFFGKW
jgi:hypothetical protein